MTEKVKPNCGACACCPVCVIRHQHDVDMVSEIVYIIGCGHFVELVMEASE